MADFLQVSILNHKNLMPETMNSVPSMMASIGYTHLGTDEFGWHYEFSYDFADQEPSDKEIIHWLKMRYFEVEVERYSLSDTPEYMSFE